MRNIVGAAALLFLAGSAFADTSTNPPKGKGKPGDACKTNADCDQSQGPQSCRAAKCQIDRIPPPT
jgi:hypothetical protein